MKRPTVRQRAFLAAYAKAGNITAAARASGQRRRIHYEWMEEEEYPALFAAAREEAIDALEDAARKRALHGSDLLLIFLLKAHRPELYRERYEVQHRGKVEVEHFGDPMEILREVEIVARLDELVERRAARLALAEPGGDGA